MHEGAAALDLGGNVGAAHVGAEEGALLGGLWSDLAGGLTMGLTGLSVAAVRATIGTGGWADVASFLFYPIGFIAVIIGRGQLFTENTLYPVILVLDERKRRDEFISRVNAAYSRGDEALLRELSEEWAAGPVPEEWRPSRCKLVLRVESDGKLIAVHVDPSDPTAWRREPYFRDRRPLRTR